LVDQPLAHACRGDATRIKGRAAGNATGKLTTLCAAPASTRIKECLDTPGRCSHTRNSNQGELGNQRTLHPKELARDEISKQRRPSCKSCEIDVHAKGGRSPDQDDLPPHHQLHAAAIANRGCRLGRRGLAAALAATTSNSGLGERGTIDFLHGKPL